MNCPVCKKKQMSPVELDKGLGATECESCGGHWISSGNYETWQEQHDEMLEEKPFSDVHFEVEDVKDAKLCPDCCRILIKYKVGHGLDFFVDHCGECGGVWLDKNEWEALRERNLHDEIHRIFSTAWQNEIRGDQMHHKLDTLYLARFGDANYAKAKEVREWIRNCEQKDSLLAFILEEDPYSI